MKKIHEGFKTNYAWVRAISGFGKQPKYDPDNTKCAWCNKSQTEILDEHLKEHDD